MNFTPHLQNQHIHIAAVIDATAPSAGSTSASGLSTSPVLRAARELGERCRIKLSLLVLAPEQSLSQQLLALTRDTESPAEVARQLEQQGSELARRLKPQLGLKVQCHVATRGFDVAAIREWVDRQSPHLLLLEHPAEQTEPMEISKKYSTLIRETPVPVWFTHPETEFGRGVIAAVGAEMVDHPAQADLDREVVRSAQQLVELFDSDLHVVQAFEPPGPAWSGLADFAADPEGQTDIAADRRAQADARLDERQATLNASLRAAGEKPRDVVVAAGDTAEVVSTSAEVLDAGLIVMGARNRPRLQALLTGTAPEETLHQADCDLLFVKTAPDAHAAAVSTGTAPDSEEAPEAAIIDMLVEPARHFEDPGAVISSSRLSAIDKRSILECWHQDLSDGEPAELRGADQEVEDTASQVTEQQRAERLRQIREALESLPTAATDKVA